MDEEERIAQFCRAYASAMVCLDTAMAVPPMGLMMAKQARQELERACELFPDTVKTKVRKLYEQVDAKRKERERIKSI